MSKGKILVVDDEEGMRITLKKILSNRGYSVTTAEDYHEASYHLQSDSFDTVITDIILYDINGIELLRYINEQTPDIPTIVITGEPNIKTAIESVRLGAYDYLIKPITKNNLPPIVDKAIEKRRLLEDKRRLERENSEYRQSLEKKIVERSRKSDTQTKEFQGELLQSCQRVTAEMVTSFLCHELQRPLHVVRNSLSSLKEKIKDHRSSTEEHVRTMEEEIQKMQEMVNLPSPPVMSERTSLEMVDISLLLKNIVACVSTPENILMKAEVPESLPSSPVHKEHIQQVIINVINNALASLAEKGGELTITAGKQGKFLEIRFHDTRSGIPESDQGKVFQPFFPPCPHMAGLDLSICKFLLEQNGGSISFHSAEEKGTTFTIQLPLQR
ncbi:MAG: response regulator [bacterium]